uniref:Nucleotide modification associated domain 1 n=1 Tax=Siphoviridae sp. ctLOE2 TaxID=2825454 RepID=A0A8S5PEK4_9CAUD|nr:MAG TPA: Nucleotide modification associated domain 1 [Siphoviridae sp. ctLOE2]
MTKITKENMQKAHDELLQTFVNKNADYGNSFESSLEEYGLIAALIRMEDKMGRLRTLIKSEAKVKDESISDTLRDLSNYALMASVWFDHKDDDDHPASERVKDLGFYSGIRIFKPGEKERFYDPESTEPTGEIEIQNAEQLRLYLNIHKEKGAIIVAAGIGRDLFYRIDFTEFYRYIKELRGVSFDESDKFEIYFNVRNDKLNKKIYVRTNDTYNTYMFHDIKSFETAINQFIAYKQYLLDKAPHPQNIKLLIQVESDRQKSNILKPRVRIDDAFVKLMLSDYNNINYYGSHSDNVKSYLNKQFIYDMFEGTTDPKYGKYYTVLSEKYGLSMISTVDATLERFLSKTFLDSFQRKLDSGCNVKLVQISQ